MMEKPSDLAHVLGRDEGSSEALEVLSDMSPASLGARRIRDGPA